MVRSPSGVKKEIIGLKKGPWSSDEDEILTKHINIHGHPNWRALPRLAGLARCGKSCRLRWTNYLQPGIKRGNFTREEEEIITNTHRLLGNRWSAIAAKLPGRTDNEIKNVWHTHLKKKLLNKDDIQLSSYTTTDESYSSSRDSEKDFILVDESIFDQSNEVQHHHDDAHADQGDQTENHANHIATACNSINPPSLPMSLQRSCSETSYNNYEEVLSPEEFPEIDESFWSDILSSDYDHSNSGSSSVGNFYFPPCYQQPVNEIPLPPVSDNNEVIMESGPQELPHISSLPDADSNNVYNVTDTVEDGGDVDDFWFDVLFRAGDHILLS